MQHFFLDTKARVVRILGNLLPEGILLGQLLRLALLTWKPWEEIPCHFNTVGPWEVKAWSNFQVLHHGKSSSSWEHGESTWELIWESRTRDVGETCGDHRGKTSWEKPMGKPSWDISWGDPWGTIVGHIMGETHLKSLWDLSVGFQRGV